MRALLAILCSLTLLVPVASATSGLDVECDIDDDLYNHCRAGRVHWVTGPACAGVAIGQPAECTTVGRIEAECDQDDDLYNHCHVGPVHWVTGPFCAGVRIGAPADCRGP